MRRGSTISLVAVALATLAAVSPARAQWIVDVQVAPDAEGRPISPWIYGVNDYDLTPRGLTYPLVRWGGNHTSRYDWELDTTNRGINYFFMNIPYAHPDPGSLPEGGIVDRLVESVGATGGDVLVTVPTLGWAPLDRRRRWGFSISLYGEQAASAPDYPDAGDGVLPDGTTFVTGNDPTDTSRVVGPEHALGWVEHLTDRFGLAAEGGVRLYALDNEVGLWHRTHRDVHPEPATYDELWARTVAVASAIREVDPDALVLGPVSWGWCDYWASAADLESTDGGCGWGPDRQAHGDLPQLVWYLEQVCAYEAEHGVRLVDVLDVHYYPQADGVALSDDESPETAERRLRSVRSLYDSGYWDESWVGAVVNLIPTLRGIIDDTCPGLGLAISEYNWGEDQGASSALAQAEVLAVFGREGVDLAARWIVPAEGTAVEDAFRLYLDYDGAGSRVVGRTVPTATNDGWNLPAYGVVDPRGNLLTFLFNKSGEEIHARVTSSVAFDGAVEVYGFDAATPLDLLGEVDAVEGVYTVVLGPKSVALAVARGVMPSTLPDEPDVEVLDAPLDRGAETVDVGTDDGEDLADAPPDAPVGDALAELDSDLEPDSTEPQPDAAADEDAADDETSTPPAHDPDAQGCTVAPLRSRSSPPPEAWLILAALAIGTRPLRRRSGRRPPRCRQRAGASPRRAGRRACRG